LLQEILIHVKAHLNDLQASKYSTSFFSAGDGFGGYIQAPAGSHQGTRLIEIQNMLSLALDKLF